MTTSTTTTSDLREKALGLRRARRYADALPLYQTMWEHDREACTTWDAWAYALCLQQTDHLDEALDMCRRIYRHDPDFGPARSLYAWCIFQKIPHSAEEESAAATLLKAADAIAKLCKADETRSPLAAVALKVAAYYLGRAAPHPDRALEWLDRLLPDTLGTEPRQLTLPDGKTVMQASNQEQYYGLRIKALYLRGSYTDCACACREALNALPAFHYDNDLWFRRYLAQSLLRTDRAKEARELYAHILPRKRAWFLLKEAGDVCLALGEEKMADYFHLSAAMECAEPDKAVRLLETLAGRCLAADNPDMARLHVATACRLRAERQWGLPISLAELADRCGLDTGALPEAHKLRDDWKALQSYWETRLDNILPPLQGRISRMLPGDRAGFVQCEKDGKTYFFQATQFRGNRGRLAEGLPVQFRIETGYDAKKDKVLPVAVALREGGVSDS